MHINSECYKSKDALLRLNRDLEHTVQVRAAELKALTADLRESQAAQQRLEAEVLMVSEREQSRLGQCLHDGLGQELSGIALMCQAMANRLRASNHPEAEEAEYIAALTSNSIGTARELAMGFCPVKLDRDGLLIALEDLSVETARIFEMDCTFSHSGVIPHFDRDKKNHLYRIVQEAVANASKPIRAKTLSIALKGGPGETCLSISNAGAGMHPPRLPDSGQEPRLMEYRARLIGARMEWSEIESGGWRLSCWLPNPEAPL